MRSKTELLREGERVDDLERNGLGIIQKKGAFCFGMDAVLLSGFAQVRESEQAIDLGTGTGIIPILLSAKTAGRRFVGLEIQPQSADMARRSVELNELSEKVEIVQGDIKEAGTLFPKASFDVVTSNPPYMKGAHGLQNPSDAKAIARHEVLCTLDDVIREGASLLRNGGRFYMVHRPRRLVEILETFSRYGLEPKGITFVHPYVDREANMVLVEAVRGGGPQMIVHAPIVVFEPDGTYTEAIRTTYGY